LVVPSEQGGVVQRPPLHHAAALLPVGEGDGELRRVTVAEQVDPGATHPQRVVDRQLIRMPGAGGQVIGTLVADACAELLRLPGAQVGRGEPVDLHAERV
jgi:hypothetical protein